MQIIALAPLSAAGESVTVSTVTADGAGNDYQYKQEYVAFIDGEGDASFGLSSTLPAGSQTIHLNFEVRLELPDNLPSGRTLVAWIGLGQDANYWAKDGNDVFFGIGLDPGNALVNVKEQPMAETSTSFESELSEAAAWASLEVATPDGFRTDGEGELRYACTMHVDFDRDGETDVTSTGSFMDSRWGLNLWLGLERWWDGAANTAGEQPLRASLNVVDNVVPMWNAAKVNGVTLTLTYDEVLDPTSVPAAGDFTVEVDGVEVNLANTTPVAVSCLTVTLSLASAVTDRQTVTVSYIAGTNLIRDAAGNDAANLANRAVTNTTPDTTAPTLNTATVNGATLTLTYDEALYPGSVPATGDFTVEVDGVEVNLANTAPVVVSDMTVTLTLASAVTPGQTVTVSYTAGTNPIRDLARNNPVRHLSGNDASNLTNQAVTNSFVIETGGNVVNISTRGLVGDGDEAMIGGFIVFDANQTVVVFAKASEDLPASLANKLEDAALTIENQDTGEVIMENDDWDDDPDQAQLIADLWGGTAPLVPGSTSSGAVLMVPAGNWTARVNAADGTASGGIAQIEVYEVQPD